ncbi:hypothetical protein V2E24_00635 [Mycoplasmopsis ciconiae]|uniref:Uncharacterized protein n=1 Tax=Mycoplasmopsis ciconiae TaxID=561067 RepID=A0ABU7MKP5_9BACT|nr:hypothetical protein [Mycoplasmopsis ciconiae]
MLINLYITNNLYNLAIVFLLITLNIIFTYVIYQNLILRLKSKTVAIDSGVIKFINQSNKKQNLIYNFNYNNFSYFFDPKNKILNYPKRYFSANDLEAFVYANFLFYMSKNNIAPNKIVQILIKSYYFINLILIFVFLLLSMALISLILLLLSSSVAILIQIIYQRKLNLAFDSSIEILRFHLDKEQFVLGLKYLKRLKYFFIFEYLNCGIPQIHTLIVLFKNWGKNE